MGWGVAMDDENATQLFIASAELGCPLAMHDAAVHLCYGYGCAMDRRAAALLFSKAEAAGENDQFTALCCNHPLETTPFGIWQPSYIYHRICAPQVRHAVFTWLLVAKHKGVSHDIAVMICSFIVTESQW